MAIHDLNAFLHAFFKAHHCQILSNDNGVLSIQLTEEMDKVLMNRPFYWHYMKKMGYAGDPMKLTLITNPDKRQEKGEWIHFGSPRLQQIIRYLQDTKKYTKLFQQLSPNKNTPLYPWLVTNIKISYQGKHKRDELFSIGLNLINGVMHAKMMDVLNTISLEKTIADYCYTLSPMIKMESGFNRIKSVLDQYIENQEHQWAVDSLQALEEETKLLHHFYTEDKEDEMMKRELQEIQERFQPKILYQVINGGLFYLATETS
ncbi:YqhG family protein [Virgibacillus chiguensis]|uniref:Uncharacterized protein n=1 Tax=Virgibacillus chiguensis TaxID=411959 RepID=A0A1M5LT40_9BACI|nr:YqhG family protein [Virgibacillus chiguensis]SHG68302.1 protein YqhG of unknown function [Virgibacillus chiguensis]